MTLPQLLGRVRKAEGPDRELRDDILVACGWTAEREYVGYGHGWVWFYTDSTGARRTEVPDIMGSIDAALALVEEVLPGFYRMVDHSTEYAEVSLTDGSVPSREVRENVSRFFGRSKSEPLAILEALLLAIIEKDKADAE